MSKGHRASGDREHATRRSDATRWAGAGRSASRWRLNRTSQKCTAVFRHAHTDDPLSKFWDVDQLFVRGRLIGVCLHAALSEAGHEVPHEKGGCINGAFADAFDINEWCSGLWVLEPSLGEPSIGVPIAHQKIINHRHRPTSY